MPQVKPMLARAVDGFDALPDVGLVFEPKWDGFRCVVFRDGDEVELGSRNERPLTRYFPDVVDALRVNLPPRCVLDGEIVVASEGMLDFDALQQRIHPAASRVERLASETPASFVAFDLLALGDRDLRDEPMLERRQALEAALAAVAVPVHLTPQTADREIAARWFTDFEGAGLDGLIAKPTNGTYVEDKRVQFKLKHQRSIDCVVAGFRMHKDGKGVGSLLLGLYDDVGGLHHLGVAASFSVKRRAELLALLEPLTEGALAEHPWGEWAASQGRDSGGMVGGGSRWNAQKDLSFRPVRVERVAEVSFATVTSGRFRGVARFERWRPDRDPASCRLDQLPDPAPLTLPQIWDAGSG